MIGREERAVSMDRRPFIQQCLDAIEPGWVIVKPVGSGDIDTSCILQHLKGYREVRVHLPLRWFEDKEWDRIREAILRAIQGGEVG